ARHDYAWVICSRGRCEEARAMLKEVLTSEHRVLGRDHTKTAATRRNLDMLTRLARSTSAVDSDSRPMAFDHSHSLITRHELEHFEDARRAVPPSGSA